MKEYSKILKLVGYIILILYFILIYVVGLYGNEFVTFFFFTSVLISLNLFIEFLIIKHSETKKDRILQTIIMIAIIFTQISLSFAYYMTDQLIYGIFLGMSVPVGYGILILSTWGSFKKDMLEKAGITEKERKEIIQTSKNMSKSKKIYLKRIAKEFRIKKSEMDKKERQIQSLNKDNEEEREKYDLFTEELAVLKEGFNILVEKMKEFQEDMFNEEAK